MEFQEVLERYSKELEGAEFEIIHTPKLGWIYIVTEYYNYSDPIKQFLTPQEMEEFIKLRLGM